jgi:cell wall assembly regulator SMI1
MGKGVQLFGATAQNLRGSARVVPVNPPAGLRGQAGREGERRFNTVELISSPGCSEGYGEVILFGRDQYLLADPIK